MVVDLAGNVIVTGQSDSHSNSDPEAIDQNSVGLYLKNGVFINNT